MIARVVLREFAKNSRIFAAFAPGANRAPQFFPLVNQRFGTLLAFARLMRPSTKGTLHETDTWNIAGRRSWLSDDALDFSSPRSTNSVGNISAKGAFEFLEAY